MGSDSNNSISRTIYSKTTTSNPYVASTTDNKGTKSSFVENSAFDYINNFVNDNIGNVLNDYLNPSLNTVTNQSLLNNYKKNLNANAKTMLENDIITPLSNRNMLRSSQATNMYNNLSNNLSDNLSNYMDNLLSQSQQNSANVLYNLLNAYLQGVNVINTNQAQSLNTSAGNAKRIVTSKGSSGNPIDRIATTVASIIPYFYS